MLAIPRSTGDARDGALRQPLTSQGTNRCFLVSTFLDGYGAFTTVNWSCFVITLSFPCFCDPAFFYLVSFSLLTLLHIPTLLPLRPRVCTSVQVKQKQKDQLEIRLMGGRPSS